MLSGNKLFTIIKKQVFDLLFPIYCIGCGEGDQWLCQCCRDSFGGRNCLYFCPVCKKPLLGLAVCSDCVSVSYLDGLASLATLNNKLMKKLIHSVKYSYIDGLIKDLGDMAYLKISSGFDWQTDYLLVPVPLHHRRYLKRGFNQSQLICELIKEKFGNEIDEHLLRRKINNQSQTKLLLAVRFENVRGIFAVNHFVPKDKTIILVDDICTTGATMQECAKVLKEAGAQKVIALVLAA